MPTKKVRYAQPLLGEANALGYLIAVPGAAVQIRQNGVECDVFADNDGTAMTNPVPTGVPVGTAGVDVRGTLLVYLNPGSGYDGVATVGTEASTFPIPDISPDVSDVATPAAIDALQASVDTKADATTTAAAIANKADAAATTAALAAKAPLASPTFTGTATFATITAPGDGTGSERFGAGSTAVGTQSTSIGNAAKAAGTGGTSLGFNASAAGANSVSVGYNSAAAGGQATAVGRSSVASGASGGPVALGYAATASGTASVAVGASSVAAAPSSLAIGNAASVGNLQSYGTAIGTQASVANGTFSSPTLAVGYQATVLEGRGTAVGAQARAEAISSTAVGRGAICTSTATHAIAVGRGAWAREGGSICIGFRGGDGATDVYFESGHTHKYDDPIDAVTITRTPSLTPIVIHGFDAFDATASPTNDVAGGPLRLAGGRGTGTAAGGSVVLQVAPAGGVSNNTKNTLTNAVTITPERVMVLLEKAVVPTANVANSGQIYINNGALTYRGAAGTVTTLAPS